MIKIIDYDSRRRIKNTSEIYKQLQAAEKEGIERLIVVIQEANEKFKTNPSEYGRLVRSIEYLSQDVHFENKKDEAEKLNGYKDSYDSWAKENFKGKDLEKYNETLKGDDEAKDWFDMVNKLAKNIK